MPEESEPENPEPEWVWWSTGESVERGAISVLACVEVAAGIGLYWWLIPYLFDTTIHLLVSVIVAPFLLLRSPQSVAAALAAFKKYNDDKTEIPLKSVRGAVLVLAAGGGAALMGWTLTAAWLAPHEGGSLFWRAAIVGWAGLQIGLAVAVAVAVAVAGAGAVAGAVAVAVAVAGAGAVAVAVAVAVVVAVTGAVAGAGVVAGAVAVAVAAPGFIVGIWSRSVFEKINATFRHLPEGWRSLSKNWRKQVWVQDFRRSPELLPEIEFDDELSEFTIRGISQFDKDKEGADRIFYFLLKHLSYMIFFIPAWLYRLSLKSMCWFWWPLVFAQFSAGETAAAVTAGAPEKAAARFEQQGKTWGAGFFALVSVLLVLHAFGLIPELKLAVPGVKDGLDLYVLIGQMGYVMLPCAVFQAELFFRASSLHPLAVADDLKPGQRRSFVLRIWVRNLLLGAGLSVMLAVFAAEWLPVLVPFAELVETRYFALFPFAF